MSGRRTPGQRMVGRDPAAIHTHPVSRRLHGRTSPKAAVSAAEAEVAAARRHPRPADGRAGPSRHSRTPSQLPAARRTTRGRCRRRRRRWCRGSAHPRPADGRAGPSRHSRTPSQPPAVTDGQPEGGVSAAVAVAVARRTPGQRMVRAGPSRRSHTPSRAPAARRDSALLRAVTRTTRPGER